MDFSRLLTPAQRTKGEWSEGETERLFNLADRWLAEELLRLARAVRAQFPDRVGDPRSLVYESAVVWHVVPEVARRLGATRLLPNEATDPFIRAKSDAELRAVVGGCLNNSSLGRWGHDREALRLGPAELLGKDIANGNPVAFAMDRLAAAPAPGADRDDWIARYVREISRSRGFAETPYWSPELRGRPQAVAPLDEASAAPAPR